MLQRSTTPLERLQAMKNYLKVNNQFSGKTVQEIRLAAAQAAAQIPLLDGVLVEEITAAPFAGEWVRAGGVHKQLSAGQEVMAEQTVILYFHGGGFVSGSCTIYRDLAARLSAASGAAVLTAGYRLAPEHPYPAANEDCLLAYRWLLDRGIPAGNIMLCGDSVGATLALMTLITLRDHGEPLPAGACLLSPHADLVHLDGDSYDSCAELDPTGSREANQQLLQAYMGDFASDYPALLSPLRMDLHGLPPMLIQAGQHEVLRSDAERLAEQAMAAGNSVELEIWENMWCAFQLLAAMLPESARAIEHIGSFIRKTLQLNAPQGQLDRI
ncbi:alpha/beta hydrolase [Paenibacillus piscarius]|uniref:alpha/beta hydrolase n=1 Tax=Paenibacillus piscarius TaxID=1089681 RepID=UPI001EE8744C|nr:alpha/beta hydrolase [Paenibacillus piscarius]